MTRSTTLDTDFQTIKVELEFDSENSKECIDGC